MSAEIKVVDCFEQIPDRERRIQELRKIDAQRKQTIEQLQDDISASKQANSDLFKKFNIQRVRNKNLIGEVADLKATVASLRKTNDEHVKSIAELNSLVSSHREELADKMKLLKNQCTLNQKYACEQQQTIDSMQDTMDLLNTALAEKQSLIADLEKQKSKVETDLRNICGDFLFNCRDLHKDEYMAILDVLQAEKESLLGQLAVQNGRLTKEREKIDELTLLTRKQQIRYNRLEFKYNECLKEQSTIRERFRRTQRIAEYLKSVAPSAAGIKSDTSLSQSSTADEGQFQLHYQLSDLKYQLDLSAEQTRMLTDRVAELTLEKSNDAELYNGIISKTKYRLVENLLERQQDKQVSSTQSFD